MAQTWADFRKFFRLNLTDCVLILYLITLSLLVIIRFQVIPNGIVHLIINLGITAGILIIAKTNQFRSSPILSFAHLFYPVFLLIWLYPQACGFRHAFISTDLDPILSRWELSLFHTEWYRVLPRALSPGWIEFFHGIYFTYYLSLGLFAALALRRQRPLVESYLFTLILTTVVHQWILILFPASGPVPLRSITMPDGWVFVPVMNWIYEHLDNGGGAFPSLHAAAALIMTVYSIQFFPRAKLFFYLFFVLILLSTLVCSFHYSIDVLAGIITGTLCSLTIPKRYESLSK